MTTSAIYTKNAGQIIEEALRDSRLVSVGQPIDGDDYARGLVALNNVTTHWQNNDINLWLLREAILPLIPNKQQYKLGPNGDECALANSFFDTELAADQIADDITLTVESTENMQGAQDILDFDPASSATGWTTFNNATIDDTRSFLLIQNGAGGVAGGADYSLDTTPGKTYRVYFDFYAGITTAGATISVRNGETDEDSISLNVNTTNVELDITATVDSITFRVLLNDASTDTSGGIGAISYVDQDSGSRIGIEMDDNTRFWTHVFSVDSATECEISAGLPSSAASNNSIFFFEDQIDRPLRIMNGRYQDKISVSEIPCYQWSREEYMDQTDKNSTGTVVNYYLSRQLNELELYVWQVASSVKNVFRFTYISPALVYSENTDILDFPSEYYMALKWAIAAEIGPQYGLPDNKQQILELKSRETLEEALSHDADMTSWLIQPRYS